MKTHIINRKHILRVRYNGKPARWYHFMILFPVFLITKLFLPFLKGDHPWKGKPMSLNSWVYQGTGMSVVFGVIYWVLGLFYLLLGWRLVYLSLWG